MIKEFTETAGTIDFTGFQKIESQAQKWWRSEKPYRAPDMPNHANKRYILGMFPYPSGNAHMGHVRVYSITDMIARHARFKGHDVLHPLGWDSFGLPAENAAIKHNVHPEAWTNANIATMRNEQIGQVGFSFDLDRELMTSSPEYYKWTQWLFLKLYEQGKVYRSHEWVNWDPVDKTVLANEQVIDGKGWRSGVPIERRQMEQWYIRITDYAEDLAQSLDTLDGWSDAAKGAQRNWIGRAEGALINFPVSASDKILKAFTTRPELVYGISAVILAPENEEIAQICTDAQRPLVDDYIRKSLLKSEVERASTKSPDGVFTGAFARHPLTGVQIPVYVANYVLNTYANGISVCIPAHQDKDYQFAHMMNLPIQPVIEGGANNSIPYTGLDGVLINSGTLDGASISDGRKALIAQLEQQGIGGARTEYRLRDWSLSRQRFWGAPIPMLKGPDSKWHSVPEKNLPVVLPQEADFGGSTGGALLENIPAFQEVFDPATGQTLLRETDTMDTFMCSAWYVWRFTDPKNSDQAWDPQKGNAWMPIDTYVGGLEHANQHMIYLRFMGHFLHDIGLSNVKEPISTFLDNGLVRMGGEKMSKSKGNIVRPDEMVAKYSADSLRMYILSDCPLNRDIDWDESGVNRKFDFLKRVNALYASYAPYAPKGVIQLTQGDVKDAWSVDLLTSLQEAADKTDHDIEKTHNLHNVVTRGHEVANRLFAERKNLNTPERNRVYGFVMQNYLKILGLMAPHLSDTLYRNTFSVNQSLFVQPWVSVSADLLNRRGMGVNIPIAVDGKKKGIFSVSPDMDDDTIGGLVRESKDHKLTAAFNGACIARVIVVRDRKLGTPQLINVVLERN